MRSRMIDYSKGRRYPGVTKIIFIIWQQIKYTILIVIIYEMYLGGFVMITF